MSKIERQTTRKPATKLPNLQKKNAETENAYEEVEEEVKLAALGWTLAMAEKRKRTTSHAG